MRDVAIITGLLLLAGVVAIQAVGSTCEKNILFLPLDERFTTRDIVINLAATTSFCLYTPDKSILPSHKIPANLTAIDAFIDSCIDNVDAMIVSTEMYMYGGLINSRISNDSVSIITARVERLLAISRAHPSLQIFLSNVVMRIPSYNGDFEEPWYWADFGSNIYTYSYYLDKYNQLGEVSDLAQSTAAKRLIPSNALDEFTWRRERNHNITMYLLQQMNTDSKPFSYLYTTLDDNAEYGFNIREAEEVKQYIASNNEFMSNSICPVYPGADEVHLTMLSKYATAVTQISVTLATVFRDKSTINNIPAYEGQAMIETLTQQAIAAGAVLVDESESNIADAVLLVNNFSEDNQLEASQQSFENRSIEDYSIFSPYITFAFAMKQPVGFCDNRYANGGDAYFVNYLVNTTYLDSLEHVAYAGWNTNGNTIGTVVANTVLLTLFKGGFENAHFNSLRILEDYYYQSDSRKQLSSFANQVTNVEGESSSNLELDLTFYERFTFKLLSARLEDVMNAFTLPFTLNSVYYPWNRTFEVGMYLENLEG